MAVLSLRIRVPTVSGDVPRSLSNPIMRALKIPAQGTTGSWYLLACVGAGAKGRCPAVPLPVLAKPDGRRGIARQSALTIRYATEQST